MSEQHLPIEWPPIVKATKIPPLIRIRDLALTIVAWVILIYFMRNFWIYAYEFVTDLVLKLDMSNLTDFGVIWNKISPFLGIASILVLWIVVLGSLRRRIILNTGLIHGKNSLRTVQQQFPLKQIDIQLLAQRFGVNQLQLEKWQNMRAVNVTIDDVTGSKTIVEIGKES